MTDSCSPSFRSLIQAYRLHPTDSAARSKLDTGLYVVATPIGNLADMSLRGLDVLARADQILCEDTRITGRLRNVFGLTAPMLPYHEHNAAQVRPGLLARLRQGAALALVSDAGTPLISDPGYRLVSDCRAEGIPVVPIPGPSAVLAALSAAGLPTDRFFFAGFLPPRAQARRNAVEALASIPGTLVFFEAAQRLPAMLADLAAGLGEREAVIARELTKRFESFERDRLPALAAALAERGPPKGEVVVLVAPPSQDAPVVDAAALEASLRTALATASVRDAATRVAAETGWPRKEVYRRALGLAHRGDGASPPEARESGETAEETGDGDGDRDA